MISGRGTTHKLGFVGFTVFATEVEDEDENDQQIGTRRYVHIYHARV